MTNGELPKDLSNFKVHFVGIKGTGMCALAELFNRWGARITGSDTTEHFYTDEILRELGIPYKEGFSASNLPPDVDLVIYSAAYGLDTNVELIAAVQQNRRLLKYTDALGAYSQRFDSSGIAGVHGKTTTTALAGTLAQALGVPAQVLAGSAVGNFANRSTLVLGDRYFIAETCEYRKHFLAFHPRRIILTSVESDHQDYYPTYESIRDAFIEYALKLPPSGDLLYCADDPGAREVAQILGDQRRDLTFIPYGFTAEGPFRITSFLVENERTHFTLQGLLAPWRLRVPGRHTVLNATAALALLTRILEDLDGKGLRSSPWDEARLLRAQGALENFVGSRRRSQIIGEAGGTLVMDDYAHHPTAIKTTLEGLKAFYPQRRLIVSFMSHTYTRTAALLDDFARSLLPADRVILHKIYPSARETYSGGVDGKTLYQRTRALKEDVRYFEEPLSALDTLVAEAGPSDLFISMGAGDNWKLARALYEKLLGRL